ncbi:MAG: hypothetical protein AMJ79_16090 [Phycisphaerae bacterium SM23_30]|nr:MAG: hypothetical protein AMJ79_16090 [Phycisphaerae bacterium SM23_30]
MKTYLDCIGCFLDQALKSARLVSDDEGMHERVLREILRAAVKMDLTQPPAVMGRFIHQTVRRFSGHEDPYRSIKDHFNRLALGYYPRLKKDIEASGDPLARAVRLAIAGNIIDFAVRSRLDDAKLDQAIEESLRADMSGAVLEDFRGAVRGAERILYLGDNAGEIVFDRLLLEQLPREKVTFVVRGGPVINDATRADAETAGITDLVEVIDNGSDVAGTMLEMCSEEFRCRFEEADLIAAKGQGNYETLNQVNKDIFFLLKVKCPVIARDIGCEVGRLVLQRNNSFPGE